MTYVLFDRVLNLDISRLKIEPVESVGELLSESYELFARVFDPSVVDPISFYEGSLASYREDDLTSAPIFVAAYFPSPLGNLVVGFGSSNLMQLRQHPGEALLAIGNLATSPHLKYRGIGSALMSASFARAASLSASTGIKLTYSATEAEQPSLGFWQKQGYLWPKGVKYLQPPLEFHDDGTPVRKEVPETLLVRRFEEPAQEIATAMVKDIILTIYENWSLRPNRPTLSSEAMRQAESYVMNRVFREVETSIPPAPTAPLIPFPPQE